MNYWLMKSEPESYSYQDLERDGSEPWDGVRNYQARNSLQAQKCGDLVLFYHSNCAEPGVVGIAKVVREAYPDHTAFDPQHKHYDARSTPDRPLWFMTEIAPVRRLARTVTLHELQGRPELEGLALIRKGNRLSVLPLSQEHFDYIVEREREASDR